MSCGVRKRALVAAPGAGAGPELIDAPNWLDQLLLAADGFIFARPLREVPTANR
jgi:hypothetical protein